MFGSGAVRHSDENASAWLRHFPGTITGSWGFLGLPRQQYTYAAAQLIWGRIQLIANGEVFNKYGYDSGTPRRRPRPNLNTAKYSVEGAYLQLHDGRIAIQHGIFSLGGIKAVGRGVPMCLR